MGRSFEMNWEGHPNFRWVKMYKGNRYRVNCEELGTPKTKEDSYQAANNWWRQKLVEICTPTVNPQKQGLIAEIERKLKYAATFAPDLVADLNKAKAQIEEQSTTEIVLPDQSVIEQNLEIARLIGITVPEDLDPALAQHLFGDRRLWQER